MELIKDSCIPEEYKETLELTELYEEFKNGEISKEDLQFLKDYLKNVKENKRIHGRIQTLTEDEVKNIIFCELCKAYFRKKEMTYENFKLLTEYLFAEEEDILPPSTNLPKENPFIAKLIHADETNFTSDFGIYIRKHIYKPLQTPLIKATDGNIVLESIKYYEEDSIINSEQDLSFINLEKNKAYIFVSTHSFCEDINAALSIMDRNAYLVLGSTDQIKYNRQAYGPWLNGMVPVDRLDPISRQNLLLKEERILNAGTSLLVFIEGAYNNTENKILEEFYSGPIRLAKKTGASIVPLASFREYGSSNIYITADRPIEWKMISKNEGRVQLRDKLATLMFELWKHHASRIKRLDLPHNCRDKFMEERKREYLKNKWTHDVWEEELKVYTNPLNPRPETVWATFDNVNITKENTNIFGPILIRRLEDKKYNFKDYMHKTWNKKRIENEKMCHI